MLERYELPDFFRSMKDQLERGHSLSVFKQELFLMSRLIDQKKYRWSDIAEYLNVKDNVLRKASERNKQKIRKEKIIFVEAELHNNNKLKLEITGNIDKDKHVCFLGLMQPPNEMQQIFNKDELRIWYYVCTYLCKTMPCWIPKQLI